MITIRLDKQTHAEFKELAYQRRTSMNALATALIQKANATGATVRKRRRERPLTEVLAEQDTQDGRVTEDLYLKGIMAHGRE